MVESTCACKHTVAGVDRLHAYSKTHTHTLCTHTHTGAHTHSGMSVAATAGPLQQGGNFNCFTGE